MTVKIFLIFSHCCFEVSAKHLLNNIAHEPLWNLDECPTPYDERAMLYQAKGALHATCRIGPSSHQSHFSECRESDSWEVSFCAHFYLSSADSIILLGEEGKVVLL